MLSSKGLKEIVTTVRPIIERQLDDAEQIAAFRDKVAESGGDWSALKALIKAQIQDERDETGDGKRVKKILDKAGFSTDYAALLGWSNMNEKNFSAEEDYDRETGEVFGDDVSAKLVATVATGMQTEIGRKALVKALDIMIEREEAEERRSDGGLNILTKHEDIRTAPETAEELQHPVPHATGANARSGGDGSMVRGARTEADAVTAGETAPHSPSGDGAIAAVNGNAGLANANGVEPPSSGQVETPSDDDADHAAANAGGDHVDGNALRVPTSNTGEGTACALPTNFIESVPSSPMKRPEFINCFPEMPNAEYERLRAGIVIDGICEPIIRDGDMIVDGWERFLASRELRYNYPIQPYTGTDILLDVIELQRAARNFTPAQEKKIAADLAKEFPHRADEIMAAFGLAGTLEAAE